MFATITDKVVFENASPNTVYDLLTDTEKHTAFTGAPSSVSKKEGDSFTAYGDYITGKNLHLEQDKLIVQSWFANGMDMKEPSLVSIRLVPDGADTHVYLTHADIPAGKEQDMLKGWEEWYWMRMKEHLTKTN